MSPLRFRGTHKQSCYNVSRLKENRILHQKLRFTVGTVCVCPSGSRDPKLSGFKMEF